MDQPQLARAHHCKCMELYNEAAALFNSNSDLQLHGEYSILDLDNINEMLQPPPPADFNIISNVDSGDSRFAPPESIVHHQLRSLPPTIGPAGNSLLGTLQALINSFHNYRKLSCGNFSSSGESSEPAVSQGSSSTPPQPDHSSKRKFEDIYYQHSSTSDLLPPTSPIGGGGGGGGGGFQIFFDSSSERRKKPRSEKDLRLQQQEEKKKGYINYGPDMEAIAQMKEMIYRAAAMRPVNQLDDRSGGGETTTSTKKAKRRNVRISSEPQTVAARQRRERISDRLRILRKLVPGGSKMDTASMLDEAANYLTFLKAQVAALETLATCSTNSNPPFQPPPPLFSSSSSLRAPKP